MVVLKKKKKTIKPTTDVITSVLFVLHWLQGKYTRQTILVFRLQSHPVRICIYYCKKKKKFENNYTVIADEPFFLRFFPIFKKKILFTLREKEKKAKKLPKKFHVHGISFVFPNGLFFTHVGLKIKTKKSKYRAYKTNW